MSRPITGLFATILLGAVLALTACAPSASRSTSGNTVTLQNLSFKPSSLSVKSGETVTFKNADSVEHHIVVGTNDLGVQQPGQDRTWKAPSDGVYVMKCVIHPSMQGQITVGATGSTVGTTPAGGGSAAPGY